MTSGVYGSTVDFGYGPGGFYKSWSGGDGKYEVLPDGSIRGKWNSFTCLIKSQFGCKQSLAGFWINCDSEPDWNSTWSSSDDVKLQSKLSEAIRGHSWNLAVDAAQGRQTVQMVTSTLSTIRRTVRALKRADILQACQLLGVRPKKKWHSSESDWAGRWLELQYGWLPTLGSVYESAKAYERITEKGRHSTGIVKMTKPGHYNASQSPSNWNGVGPYKHTKRIQFELFEELTALRSIGLLDPWSLAWEMLPFSFVVDWFMPIGSYLDNLSILGNVNGRFLTTERRKFQCRGFGLPTSPGYVGAVCNNVVVRVDRLVQGGLTVAKPSLISLPDAMSPKRVWNAIALTQQVFLPVGRPSRRAFS